MTTSVQSQGTRGVAPPVPPTGVATSWRIEPWRIAPLWQADRVALGDLLGNPGAVAGLRHALDSGQLGHALLVTGPDQVGKTTLMLSLAAELLPRGSWPGDPAAHPDLWLEDSPEERISIRRVRAGGDPGSLQEFLGLRTWAGGDQFAAQDHRGAPPRYPSPAHRPQPRAPARHHRLPLWAAQPWPGGGRCHRGLAPGPPWRPAGDRAAGRRAGRRASGAGAASRGRPRGSARRAGGARPLPRHRRGREPRRPRGGGRADPRGRRRGSRAAAAQPLNLVRIRARRGGPGGRSSGAGPPAKPEAGGGRVGESALSGGRRPDPGPPAEGQRRGRLLRPAAAAAG